MNTVMDGPICDTFVSGIAQMELLGSAVVRMTLYVEETAVCGTKERRITKRLIFDLGDFLQSRKVADRFLASLINNGTH